MKSKLIAVLCAVALAMSVPTLAFATEYDSPGGSNIAQNNGTTLQMDGDFGSEDGYIVVEASSTHASNAVIKDGDYAASFRAYMVGMVEFGPNSGASESHVGADGFGEIGLTFNVPERYIGADGCIYISYASGNQAAYPVTIDELGNAYATITEIYHEPSYFTIVVNAASADPSAPETDKDAVAPEAGKDTSATSPQTGVDSTAVAVAAGSMLVAAAGVAVMLRRKTGAN